ncbi:hypothetical protein EYF80_047357 [Liparis tanakae]|uniref:Uncharacterized protein n=1 Tax=Liparis tanakae TaxID=230148 RepID=A0A4Z2FN50_9TELE|nr:hypothetical protein EYF80_047357 [Liparis tanakae]
MGRFPDCAEKPPTGDTGFDGLLHVGAIYDKHVLVRVPVGLGAVGSSAVLYDDGRYQKRSTLPVIQEGKSDRMDRLNTAGESGPERW